MSPHELKELPKDSEDEFDHGAVLVSEDEDDAEVGEPEPPVDPEADPVHVDVENDEEDEEDDDEEEPDEEDIDDEDDDETSEGGKVDDEEEEDEDEEEEDKDEDGDSDDEDEGEDKRPFNGSDDEDEDEDDDDGLPAKKKRYMGGKTTGVGRGKVMPGVSFPLTSRQEYKGDIEDLLRAAAQAEEGETSSANNHTEGSNNLISAAVSEEDVEVTEVTIKETSDIECAVVDILDGEDGQEEEEQEEEDVDADDDDSDDEIARRIYRTKEGIKIFKDSDDSQNVSDDGFPPVKRMKTL